MILLLPKYLTVKTYWKTPRGQKRSHALWIRDLILVGFSLLLIVLLGQGTIEALTKIGSGLDIAYIPPSIPIGLTLMLLHVMLLFSNVVTAVGALFMAHDLDLIHASPIKPRTFYIGKLFEVFLSSSWMACIFGIPVLGAVGIYYHGGILYYLACIVGGFLYLLMPSAVSLIIVTLLAYAVPVRRTKEILIACCGVVLFSLFYSVKLFLQITEEASSTNDLLKLISYLHVSDTAYTPSSWLAKILSELLISTPHTPTVYLWGALVLTTLGLALCAMGVLGLLYKKALSRSISTNVKTFFTSSSSFSFLELILPRNVACIIKKEYLLFARDMTQAAQLFLLLGLTSIYMYNFKMLGSAKSIPQGSEYWWQALLIIVNLTMGAFVITAICSRFVFPSVSLEGQGYWSLKKSPMSLESILKAKHMAWFIPVLCIGSILFLSASWALNTPLDLLFAVVAIGTCTGIGLLGLAVGLGGYFSNFTWEHPAQLAASFGSLVFMMSAVALIGCNIIPTVLILFIRYRYAEYLSATIVSTLILTCIFNVQISRFAIKIGVSELERRAREE